MPRIHDHPLALFLIPAALSLAGCTASAVIGGNPGTTNGAAAGGTGSTGNVIGGTSADEEPGPPCDGVAFKVLVDASKDGGVWWFPQSGNFDPDEPHQGEGLADYLKSLGAEVTELGRNRLVTPELLESYDLVIRAAGFESYLDSELDAYDAYVAGGGQLLLLADWMGPGEGDQLADIFGIGFAGITRGNNVMLCVADDPIAQGTDAYGYAYGVGSGIVGMPPGATMLATLDDGTYLDLDYDEVQDSDEPSAPPVMGILDPADGVVVFLGDTNTLEYIPQPLVDNLMRFFCDGAR